MGTDISRHALSCSISTTCPTNCIYLRGLRITAQTCSWSGGSWIEVIGCVVSSNSWPDYLPEDPSLSNWGKEYDCDGWIQIQYPPSNLHCLAATVIPPQIQHIHILCAKPASNSLFHHDLITGPPPPFQPFSSHMIIFFIQHHEPSS
jgi:hypothetical protein